MDHPQTFWGGVTALLCGPCRTKLNDILVSHPSHGKILELDARQAHYDSLAQAGQPVDEQRWLELRRFHHAINMELRPVVENFVKTIG